MSAEWPYAKLAKLASNFGGPEKFMAIVKNRSFQEGVRAGKVKMIPVIFGALGLGILGTVGFQKYKEYKFTKKTKCKKAADEAAEAENILIQGMKAADQDESE